jgi:Zn-dependent protease
MFRLLGFEVQVRTGFLIFLGLIVFLYQDGFGLWLAGALAIFTLLHELGHAVAARRAGADASISLDFLAGYTAFRPDPRRPISRRMRAVISAAGPMTQIVISMAVLIAMGVDPFSLDSVRQSDAAAAIWWAGPMIGVLNLIPVLPLDGGHLAMTGLETFLGKRAMRTMAIASLAITATGAALLFASGRGGFAIFVAFLLLNQFQILQMTSTKRGAGHPLQRHADAETLAWQTGRPGMLEPGQRLSPWYEAHRALIAGDRDRAASVIVDDLRSSKPPTWSIPAAASPQQLRAVIDALPRDLPAGNQYSARVLADVLLATGEVRRAGEYAAEAFGVHRSSPLASIVARASAAFGDDDNALLWLRAAAATAAGEAGPYGNLLGRTMDQAPEFSSLRADPQFRSLRAALSSTIG